MSTLTPIDSILSTASFLDATARRHERGDIRDEELRLRLTDCASTLREAVAQIPSASRPSKDQP